MFGFLRTTQHPDPATPATSARQLAHAHAGCPAAARTCCRVHCGHYWSRRQAHAPTHSPETSPPTARRPARPARATSSRDQRVFTAVFTVATTNYLILLAAVALPLWTNFYMMKVRWRVNYFGRSTALNSECNSKLVALPTLDTLLQDESGEKPGKEHDVYPPHLGSGSRRERARACIREILRVSLCCVATIYSSYTSTRVRCC